MPVYANIEAIWVVIIIISVIAQIVKGVKKAASQQRPPGNTARPPHPAVAPSGRDDSRERRPANVEEPVDALQEFLRSLAGETPTPRPPRPAPPVTRQPVVPPGVPRAKPARTTHRAPAVAVRENVPMTEYRPVEPILREETDVAPAVTLDHELHEPSRAGAIARDIKRGMGDRKAIRRAVVLREILGPPLALR